MQEGETEPRGWLWVIDAAPCHTAASFLSWLKEQKPWVHPCFVPAGYTAVCQPCDVAFMRSFKSSIRAAAADDFAEQIVRAATPSTDGVVVPKLDVRPVTLRRKLVHWAGSALQSFPEETWHNAWKKIICQPEEEESIWEAANVDHRAGILFRRQRGRAHPPENAELETQVLAGVFE
jgi:hypothetical protein